MSRVRSYQTSLFDPSPDRKPAVVLDITQGRQLRDEGIEKAVLHADQDSADWRVNALDLLKTFLKDQHSEFMAEDLRSYAALIDFPLPPNARAWGGIIVKAKNEGIIRFVTTRQVRNKNAHCANANVWIRTNG